MELIRAHFCSLVSRSESSLHLHNNSFVPSLKCGDTAQITCFKFCRPHDVHGERNVNNTHLEISGRSHGVHGERIVNSTHLEISGLMDANCPRRAYAIEKKFLAPLQLESSEGVALMEMLQNHGHGHLSCAARQQLEILAAQRELAGTYDVERKTPDENQLYRGIAALKERERIRAVQDIMYALVVERMMEAGWSMALPLASPECKRKTDFVPENDKKLEALHAPEVRKLIEEHVAMVIGGRNPTSYFDPDAFTRVTKPRLGKIYAASVMYGYFLARIHHRFQLEKRVRRSWSQTDGVHKHERAGGWDGGMKAYVGSLDGETQRLAMAEESLEVIERHVEAMFGKPDEMLRHNDATPGLPTAIVYMKLGAVKSLLLEALALGSALWGKEAFVASFYPLSFDDS